MPLDEQPMALNPDTPLAWIYAQLRGSAALATLLGATDEDPRIYTPGEVPMDEDGNAPPLHVMIVPPEGMDVRYTAERYPQSQSGRFLIYAEGHGQYRLDEVLTPIQMQLQEILAGVDNPDSPTGGAVYSSSIGPFYTPRLITLTSSVQLKHKGFYLTIQAV